MPSKDELIEEGDADPMEGQDMIQTSDSEEGEWSTAFLARLSLRSTPCTAAERLALIRRRKKRTREDMFSELLQL